MKIRWLTLIAFTGLCGCGTEEGSLANGEECDDSAECESGYCEISGDDPAVCKDRCVANGNACGPVGQAGGCCSGNCGSNGTCEM